MQPATPDKYRELREMINKATKHGLLTEKDVIEIASIVMNRVENLEQFDEEVNGNEN